MVFDVKAKSLATMKNPDEWRLWPFLPLVRRDGRKPDLGFLVDNCAPVVTIGNVFTDSMSTDGVRYESYEAIIADGWVVD